MERPDIDAGYTFKICISSVRSHELKRRLTSVRPDIQAAAAEYEVKAEAGHLHLIPVANMVGGCVTKDEMVKVYDQRMVGKKGPGRTIYDQIKLLPEGDRCPLCDQRNVSTLDHILPKTLYPALAVAPDNLVGACFECNKAKLATAPVTPQDTLLHPYFDDVSHEQWLKAGIVPQAPPAVIFRVEAPHSWPADLTIRVRHQFDIFGLPSLYSSEAAREISNIRHNLQTHFDAGGTGAVQNELMRQWYSRRANRLNSWQTATYEALAHDAWFCDGGFA